MVNELSIFRGDTESIGVTITDSAGATVNITGYTFFFTVKGDESDGDASALISTDVATHTDPVNGVTAISLPAGSTNIAIGTWFYDLQMKDIGGNITTLLKGDFVVKKDISVRTT